MTTAELEIGTGYPQPLLYGGFSYTQAVIYASGAPNNALCASVGGARKRRAIDTGKSRQQQESHNLDTSHWRWR